jgi:hypothetical protein
MLSEKIQLTRVALLLSAALVWANPARADIVLSPSTNGGDFEGTTVCAVLGGLFLSGDSGECEADDSVFPDTLTFESGTELETLSGSIANFSGAVNFNSNNVQFNSSNVAFGGGSATFNNTVSFTGPSVTFDTLADFNNGVTTDTITNSGNISTSTLLATGVGAGNVLIGTALTVQVGASVDLGGNVVHGIAAGVADTDAVNVAQLNAATSGITTDVTALETVTATHTTQIADIQTVNSTQATQITDIQTVNTAQSTQITDIQTVNTTQATQISALQASDAGFDTRIDTLELLSADLDDRIDRIDDRASAGTAAAVALSGAMFLPGKTFNLTGNVGSYRGAHAAALQFGALVSDHVALNAGVAHGFNKGGKTAIRAGFTIGW